MKDSYLFLVNVYNKTLLEGHCFNLANFRWYLKTHGWPVDDATEAALAAMRDNKIFKY